MRAIFILLLTRALDSLKHTSHASVHPPASGLLLLLYLQPPHSISYQFTSIYHLPSGLAKGSCFLAVHLSSCSLGVTQEYSLKFNTPVAFSISAMAPPTHTSPMASHNLANDPFSIEDFSDSEPESPCIEATHRNVAKSNRKSKIGKVTRKSKSVTTKATPSPKRGLKALESAASFLGGIGSVEDVTDWLDDKGLTDEEVIRNLRRACTAISDLLKARASPVNTGNRVSESSSGLDEYFIYRAASNSVMLLGPIESIRCNRYYSNKKVLGFIRRRGEGYPFMIAFPGWTPCAEAHEKVLDSEIWTKYVMQFAKNVGFTFQEDRFEVHNKIRPGTTHASHVEPKLLLFFACHIFIKRMKRKANLKQLHLLRHSGSTTEVEIFISEEPCYSCKKFKREIETVTGLKFHFRVCRNLATLKFYRNTRGCKTYPSFAADEAELVERIQIEEEDNNEEYEEYERRFPLQPRSPNIMVIMKSHISSTKTEITHAKLSSVKNQSLAIIDVTKPPCRKRQYEDTEDEDDYAEPQRRLQSSSKCAITPPRRTRASIKSGTGLMSPTPTPSSSHRYTSKMERVPAEDVAPHRQRKHGGKRVRSEHY